MNEIMRRFVKGLIMERNSVVGSIPMAVMLAGKHTQEEQTPIAYLYNGVRLPKLPESELRYAVIWDVGLDYYRLMLSSELPYAVTTDNGSYLHFPGAHDYYDNKPKPYKWTYVGNVDAGHTGYAPGSVVWSNFDLCYEDGTLVCTASEPVPTPLDYVIATLFDGEVTTTENDNGTVCMSENLTFADDAGLYTNCAYRIAVDGNVSVEDVVTEGLLKPTYLGNAYLADPENYADNGGTWCLKYHMPLFKYERYLYTRTPGIYRLKLESVRE